MGWRIGVFFLWIGVSQRFNWLGSQWEKEQVEYRFGRKIQWHRSQHSTTLREHLIYKDRMTARIDGDFVVFLIGMRINKPLAVLKYFSVLTAMPKMLN